MEALREQNLSEILKSERRRNILKMIDEKVVQQRCAPICAHHEMNIILDQANKHNITDSRSSAGTVAASKWHRQRM